MTRPKRSPDLNPRSRWIRTGELVKLVKTCSASLDSASLRWLLMKLKEAERTPKPKSSAKLSSKPKKAERLKSLQQTKQILVRLLSLLRDFHNLCPESKKKKVYLDWTVNKSMSMSRCVLRWMRQSPDLTWPTGWNVTLIARQAFILFDISGWINARQNKWALNEREDY